MVYSAIGMCCRRSILRYLNGREGSSGLAWYGNADGVSV